MKAMQFSDAVAIGTFGPKSSSRLTLDQTPVMMFSPEYTTAVGWQQSMLAHWKMEQMQILLVPVSSIDSGLWDYISRSL